MEFRDLKEQYLQNKKEIDAAIESVLLSSHYIGGEVVKNLESQLADYVGVRHCITCANGTDALQLALMAWNIGAGDAVFVPDFTFFSSGEVVPLVGATPIFVDVDKETFNLSVSSLERMIQKVLSEGELIPKVVIAVDLFGQPAEYEAIRKIADKYDMLLLEDGAQGFGGRIGSQKACSFGNVSTTSFFPAKPLGCYGDGGAIFTNDDNWAELIRSLCVHGKGKNKYDNIRIGLNSRLDAVQAAILQVKLRIFEDYELESVNQVARWYNEKLCELEIELPKVKDNYYSSWAQYTIRLNDEKTRDKLQIYLKQKGIPSMVYYVKPMHRQDAFFYKGNECEEEVYYNNTIQLCKRALSLPMHPYMLEEDVDLVVENIRLGMKG